MLGEFSDDGEDDEVGDRRNSLGNFSAVRESLPAPPPAEAVPPTAAATSAAATSAAAPPEGDVALVVSAQTDHRAALVAGDENAARRAREETAQALRESEWFEAWMCEAARLAGAPRGTKRGVPRTPPASGPAEPRESEARSRDGPARTTG